MALRGIEGWSGYTGLTYTTFENILQAKWPGSYWMDDSTVSTDSDRFPSEDVWRPTDSGSEAWVFDLLDNPEEIACGLYLKSNSGSSSRNNFYPIITINNGSYAHIQIEASPIDIRVKLLHSSTVVATFYSVLEARRWNLIELKAKVHDTTGYWEIYVNGVLIGSNTGIDTKYSTYNVNQVRFHGGLAYNKIGDTYCCDLTGSKNNDVLGPFHIQGILPNANGDDSDWTPSANADNYTMVNDVTANESDYVESGTPADQDLYNYENLSGTWDEIFGLQINTRLFMDSANSETIAVLCSSNSTEDSANFTANNDSVGMGDEAQFMRILENDPDTSNAWDPTDIDSAQFGVKFI